MCAKTECRENPKKGKDDYIYTFFACKCPLCEMCELRYIQGVKLDSGPKLSAEEYYVG